MLGLMRTVQDAAMPRGSAWDPVPDGDNDNLLEGMAKNQQSVEDDLDQLQWVRNPFKTTLLTDLEKEYGTYNGAGLTEAQRRARLNSAKNARQGDGTDVFMQARLQKAGFNVQVHRNNPAIDPSPYVDASFKMVAGGFNAYAGRSDAFASQSISASGRLIVNGDSYTQSKAFLAQANGANTFAGNTKACAGYFEELKLTPIPYQTPPIGYWHMVFFVGGNATRDVNGYITNIDFALIPASRLTELKELIVKYKPQFDWAVLVATLT